MKISIGSAILLFFGAAAIAPGVLGRNVCSPGYYGRNPECNPQRNCAVGSADCVREGVTCTALGSSVPIGGNLYYSWEFHYNVMGSRYYFARIAEALGLQCATNLTMLAEMDLVTPWSGALGAAIAVDGAYGFDRLLLRRCVPPTAPGVTPAYPFLCEGSDGNPGTCGWKLGTLSYISLLHDDANHRWTLFGHCWNAQTPENPNAVPITTSWNVFSLDPVLPAADRTAIIAKLNELGYSTAAASLIEPNFTLP